MLGNANTVTGGQLVTQRPPLSLAGATVERLLSNAARESPAPLPSPRRTDVTMAEKQRCPRRLESLMPDAYGGDKPFPDRWQNRAGRRACSYCGSLHPDDFMEVARTGAHEIGPTDKSYKVYVDGAIAGDGGKFYFQHLSEEQMQEFVDLYNSRPRRRYGDDLSSFTIVQDGGGHMAVGYPGYFYRLPFFMK